MLNVIYVIHPFKVQEQEELAVTQMTLQSFPNINENIRVTRHHNYCGVLSVLCLNKCKRRRSAPWNDASRAWLRLTMRAWWWNGPKSVIHLFDEVGSIQVGKKKKIQWEGAIFLKFLLSQSPKEELKNGRNRGMFFIKMKNKYNRNIQIKLVFSTLLASTCSLFYWATQTNQPCRSNQK